MPAKEAIPLMSIKSQNKYFSGRKIRQKNIGSSLMFIAEIHYIDYITLIFLASKLRHCSIECWGITRRRPKASPSIIFSKKKHMCERYLICIRKNMGVWKLLICSSRTYLRNWRSIRHSRPFFSLAIFRWWFW